MEGLNQKIRNQNIYSLSFRLFLLSALSMILVFSVGCSKNELSRDKAKDIIVKQLRFPIIKSGELRFGSKTTPNLHLEALEAMAREGVISYKHLGEKFLSGDEVSVSLTEEGKKYAIGDAEVIKTGTFAGANLVKVKLCEQQFVEVTGIALSEGKKEAEVDFTWKYSNVTPFGKNWEERGFGGSFSLSSSKKEFTDGKLNPEKVHMKLYDDGWRLVE
jgi:hypothetical protein